MKLVFIALTFCFGMQASADTPFSLEPAQAMSYMLMTPIPKVLFHWTTERSLRELQKNRSGDDALGLKPIAPNPQIPPIVVATVPSLRNRLGIFLSANPVTGVGFNSQELYVRQDSVTKAPPLLLMVRLKSNLEKAIVLTNDVGEQTVIGDPLRADIIHHMYIDNMGIALQEWILMNPNVVESATADPTVTKPILVEKLREVQSGYLKERVIERHSTMSLGEAARTMRRVLDSWNSNPKAVSRAVPELFKSHHELKPNVNSCSQIFTN